MVQQDPSGVIYTGPDPLLGATDEKITILANIVCYKYKINEGQTLVWTISNVTGQKEMIECVIGIKAMRIKQALVMLNHCSVIH